MRVSFDSKISHAGHLHPMGSDSFLSLTSMFFLLPCTSMSLAYHSQGVCHIVEVESRFSDVQAVVRSGSESLCHNAWHKLQSLSLRGMFEYVKRVAFFSIHGQGRLNPLASSKSWSNLAALCLSYHELPPKDTLCWDFKIPCFFRLFTAFSGFFVEMRFRATKKEASQGRPSHGRKLTGWRQWKQLARWRQWKRLTMY